MLTKLLESSRKQCAIYWPTYKGTPTMFGHIIVTLTNVEHVANYTIRTFHVKHSSAGEEERLVTQFQVSFKKVLKIGNESFNLKTKYLIN